MRVFRRSLFCCPIDWRQLASTPRLLRQKTTTAAADGPTGYQRVRLEFQDDVMGQLVVTVKHDRLLSDGMQTAPIPDRGNR